MEAPSDLPIAVRRARRSSTGPSVHASSIIPGANSTTTASTPRKKTRSQPKKRVHFSDPGPASTSHPSDDDELALSTGLTPMIRRTSLSHRPPRRHSTPARSSSGSGAIPHNVGSSPFSGEVRILPLCQVLDGRVQRRIRRNGLSEEMNSIAAERRRRAREGRDEIERLRSELQHKDAEIARLREGYGTCGDEDEEDATVVLDTERVWALQREVDGLRRELAERAGTQGGRSGGRSNNGNHGPDSSPSFTNWTLAARDPFSDSVYMDVDVDADLPVPDAGDDADDEELGLVEFGDATMADLVCSTPTRRRGGSAGRSSFPTPPTTSPAAASFGLRTPTPARTRMATPYRQTDSGVQAEMPDAEKLAMAEEIASLHLETAKLTATLEGYAGMASRLSTQLAPFSPLDTHASSNDSPQRDLEARLAALLQTVSDRTAALLHLISSLSDLGFAGADASEIVASLRGAFRSARLELEYLRPGESTLPLSSAGAAVLDMLLDRLRDLAKRAREADEHIDEYHEIEGRLRKQLAARVDAMKAMDAETKELQVGVERLKSAVQSYARDIAELEKLVERLEGQLKEAEAEKGEKSKAVEELEARLKEAVQQTEELRGQLTDVQEEHKKAMEEMRRKHSAEIGGLNAEHGRSLALRDARVGELRLEVERVEDALRAAHETVQKLRLENAQGEKEKARLKLDSSELKEKMEGEKRRAREAIDRMKEELERVARMSESFMATPKKADGKGKKVVRFSGVERRDSALGGEEVGDVGGEASSAKTPKEGGFLAGGLARKGLGLGQGRKRRRYDSGLGFLDDDGDADREPEEEEYEMF